MKQRFFSIFALLSLTLCLVFAPAGLAQSTISGEIGGTVTDPSGQRRDVQEQSIPEADKSAVGTMNRPLRLPFPFAC